MIHLLLPMSGQGTRFQKAGFTKPKPLIEVSGRPMIERLLEKFPLQWPTHFVMAENHRPTDLPALLKKLRPEGRQSFIAPHSVGPGKALLEGLQSIPDDEAVLVSYCDYGKIWDAFQFEQFVKDSDCDACVICYQGFHAHYLGPNKYAYCRMDGESVVEVREKGSFTDEREKEFASSGAYYFKSAALLKKALDYQFKNDLFINGESYTSLTVEALLRLNPKSQVRVFEIPYFFQWGTPEDLRDFEYWEKSYRAYNRSSARGAKVEPGAEAGQRTEGPRTEVAQVLMPMAGLGSRFTQLSTQPKPLIPLNGQPMFAAALDTLPQAQKTTLVALDSFAKKLELPKSKNNSLQIVSLAQTPAGQALSTEAGLASLDAKREVIVSSCDHGIVLDPARWQAFHAAPNCDAAIFTVRGFPGARRRPKAYAYVQSQSTPGEGFAPVQKVSVKVPLSDSPQQDAVLVGTFWFKSVEILQKGIEALKAQDLRVNGELYLDSVFNVFIEQGLKVREIPLEGYLCWGDPESLSESLYWYEVFCGRTISPRSAYPGLS